MLVYFICLFVVTIAAYLAQSAGTNKYIARLLIFVAFATMVFVAGMRGSSVGRDTALYVKIYERTRMLPDTWESVSEPGYLILNVVTHRISRDYWMILTAIAVVTVFCFMKAIYRISINPAISLFIFITMGYYTFFFNGARQGIACAIYCLSYKSMIDGKFLRYALYVVIAASFHNSVILALPLYFLFRQKCSLMYVIQTVFGAGIVICFFSWFLSMGALVSEKYSMYQEMDATGGERLTLFYALLSVFFLIFRPAVSAPDRKTYDYLLNMLIFGATIYIVVVFSHGFVQLMRFAFYFQVSTIFLWPIVLKSVCTPCSRVFSNPEAMSPRQLYSYQAPLLLPVYTGFQLQSVGDRTGTHMESILIVLGPIVLGHLVYFYIFLSQIGSCVPYRLNTEVTRYFFGSIF